MGRGIRQCNRRPTTSDTSPPKKRPCTITPKPNKCEEKPETMVDIPHSSFQSEKEGVDLDNLIYSYDVISRILGKANVSREEYDQVLSERDLALNELNNLKEELKEVQNSRSKAKDESESGKNVWEAEKKALTERLDEFDLASKVLEAEKKALTETVDGFELGKKVLEGEKKALTERLDKEFSNFAAELKEVLESLSRSKAELERTTQERDSFRNSLELGKKEWEDEKKALTERLNKEFNNFGAELKQMLKNLSDSEAELEKTSQKRDTYRNSLELGNNVWEAERIKQECVYDHFITSNTQICVNPGYLPAKKNA